MSEELKPCHCKRIPTFQGHHTFEVQCACGMASQSITAWNTRPSPWIKINTDEDLPGTDDQVFCILEHFKTKGRKHAALFKVDEDDVSWRTADDNSEISYDWNVIAYMPIPELKPESEDKNN